MGEGTRQKQSQAQFSYFLHIQSMITHKWIINPIVKIHQLVSHRLFGSSAGSANSQSKISESNGIQEAYKSIMSSVPQPMVVVTSACKCNDSQSLIKRGITCSSFTSVSLDPPIVSFAVNQKSRMHHLLLK